MSVDYRELRERIHHALAEHVELDPDLAGGVLSGWLVVFESVGADGRRTLSTRTGDALGTEPLTPWTSEGWARYAACSGMFDGIRDLESDGGADDDEA